MSATFLKDLRAFYCCWQNRFAIKTFLCNILYLYIVDSDIYLNNTHRTHCCLNTATVVTRINNNVTLCVHRLSFPRHFQGLAEQETRPVLLGSLSFGMHFYATFYTFTLLTVTFISTIHTERIAALTLQRWLRE